MAKTVTIKHRNKPCGSCPFARKNNLDTTNPGGSHPSVYIGQAAGPFWLPCHKDKNYDDKNSSPSKVVHCAGAAIFRTNAGLNTNIPDILSKPEDHELVFSTPKEFVEHYMPSIAHLYEEPSTIETCLRIEIGKREVTNLGKPEA